MDCIFTLKALSPVVSTFWKYALKAPISAAKMQAPTTTTKSSKYVSRSFRGTMSP